MIKMCIMQDIFFRFRNLAQSEFKSDSHDDCHGLRRRDASHQTTFYRQIKDSITSAKNGGIIEKVRLPLTSLAYLRLWAHIPSGPRKFSLDCLAQSFTPFLQRNFSKTWGECRGRDLNDQHGTKAECILRVKVSFRFHSGSTAVGDRVQRSWRGTMHRFIGVQ